MPVVFLVMILLFMLGFVIGVFLCELVHQILLLVPTLLVLFLVLLHVFGFQHLGVVQSS